MPPNDPRRRPPPGGPPRRPPPPTTGDGVLGSPFDDPGHGHGYRDYGQGDPRPAPPVIEPSLVPTPSESRQQELGLQTLKKFFQRSVVFSKRPANVEPPWFAKTLIKAKCGLVVPAGSTAKIFDKRLEDRQRQIVTMIAIELAPIAPLLNCQLEFWFENSGTIIPIFDDQTPLAYGGSTPIINGRTTVLPGSTEAPFCLFSNGLAFRVKGPTDLTFNVQNKSGVPVTIRGLLGWYYYWTSYGATEFEAADVQL